jgi:O-acetyl-ADP-ribose deacetylase (regulator of RNase III)
VASSETELCDVSICTDPWETVEVDAFVCPTNMAAEMSQFPAARLKELAGPQVEAAVMLHTPLAIGAGVVTDAGAMRARNLIHVPNTIHAGGKVQVEDVLRAAAAVKVICKLKGFTSVAVPLMGAFEAGIPAEEAARAIHSEFRVHHGTRGLRVLLMAKDADEVEVFEMAIEGNG